MHPYLEKLLALYRKLLTRTRGLALLHGLSEAEFFDLYPRAWELAYYVLNSNEQAEALAHQALKGLAHGMVEQAKRMKHEARAPRRELILSRPQMVQRLVLEATIPLEMRFYRDRPVLVYIQYLATMCLANSSFFAAIAVNAAIYDCQLSVASRMYALLVGEDEKLPGSAAAKEKRQTAASRTKKAILVELGQQFGDFIRRDERVTGESLLIYDDLGEADRAACKRHLRAFAPWEASCRLPPGFSPGEHVEDLHGKVWTGAGRSAAEDPRLEINRVYALVHPEIYRRLSLAMSFDPQFRIPRFHFHPQSDGHEGA